MGTRLDSHALRQFLAVAEARSFRQAAESLHISQPPLSRAIRQLEARLGTALFDRDTQHVDLTPAGERLLPYARRILALLDEAQAAMRAPVEARRLRVGLTSAVEPQWFQRVSERLEAAGVTLGLAHDTSPRLVKQLSAGRLDAAFIALPTHAPDLLLDTLAHEPLVAVLPATHRLARRRTLGLADLSQEPLFWFPRARQPAFFDHCQAVFRRHAFAPQLLEEPKDHPMLLAAVGAGRGVALLPASFAALRRTGIAYRPLREGDELGVGIGLATPPDRAGLRTLLLRHCQARK